MGWSLSSLEVANTIVRFLVLLECNFERVLINKDMGSFTKKVYVDNEVFG